MRLRLRLSLFARMAVSLAILLSITLVVAALLATVGGMLGLALLGWVYRLGEAAASLPRVSAVAPVPPAAVAAAAIAGVFAAVRGWPHVRARTDETYLLPPTTPVSAAVTVCLFGCLYLFVVEGGAATLAALSTTVGIVAALTVGVVLAVGGTVAEVRRRIGNLRADLLEDSAPVERAHPEVATAVRRLSQLVDVPEPTARITDTDRPESITVGTGEDAIVLVSSGLLDVLTAEELEAVLAHEVSHLANGDGRVMGAALAPVLAADQWIEDQPDGPDDRFWNGLFTLLKRYGQFGVAVLSRGREWCADDAAAELTGSPAALASALRRLEDARGAPTPDEDLREWERSVAAMDVLPPAEPDVSTGPFRTHPPTEARVERLKRLAETNESAG